MARSIYLALLCVVTLTAVFAAEPSCGENERWACVVPCPPQRTCRNRRAQFSCPPNQQKCEYKCVCNKGYFRNAIGECITEAECDSCNAPNEFYSCNSGCDNECSTIGFRSRTRCPLRGVKCRCYCDDGTARNSKGICVPVDECDSGSSNSGSSSGTAVNIVDNNSNSGSSNSGSSSGTAVDFVDNTNSDSSNSASSSGSAVNFVDNTNSGSSNSASSSGSAVNFVDNNTNSGASNSASSSGTAVYFVDNNSSSGSSNSGSSSGTAVNFVDSSRPPRCGENEEYVQEKQTCPPELCESIVARYDCSREPPRQPGCACKSGYLRLRDTSPCIPVRQCPQLANSNSVLRNGK